MRRVAATRFIACTIALALLGASIDISAWGQDAGVTVPAANETRPADQLESGNTPFMRLDLQKLETPEAWRAFFKDRNSPRSDVPPVKDVSSFDPKAVISKIRPNMLPREPLSSALAQKSQGQQTQSLSGANQVNLQAGCSVVGGSPEVAAMARSLGYNYDLIHDYVYHEIAFEPTWGGKKGALGALINKRGTQVDQNMLFVEMLRHSCINAKFRIGDVTYPADKVAHLFGVENKGGVLTKTLAAGGFAGCVQMSANPNDCATGTNMGTPQFVRVFSVWTEATVGGVTHRRDPSFKSYAEVAPGIADIFATMMYSKASFLAEVEGTVASIPNMPVGVTSWKNFDGARLEALLNGYTQKIADHIRANLPMSSTKEVFGGRKISDVNFTAPDSLPATGVLADDVPLELQTRFVVTVSDNKDGSNPVLSWTGYAPQLAGKRLTVRYDYVKPIMVFDGFEYPLGPVTTKATQYVTVTTTHPYIQGNQQVTLVDTMGISRVGGNVYAVILEAGRTGRGAIAEYQHDTGEALQEKNAKTSEAVMGPSLAAMGTAYAAQWSALADVQESIGTSLFYLHQFIGIAGQDKAPYVDFPGVHYSSVAKTVAKPDTEPGELTNGFYASGLESTVVAQMQGDEAASTMRLFKLANKAGASQRGFVEATASNWALLDNGTKLPNWALDDRKVIRDYFVAHPNARVIMHQKGSIVLNDWTGGGWIGLDPAQGQSTYKITGGYSGGYGSIEAVIRHYEVLRQNILSSYYSTVEPLTSIDPIDMLNGDFTYEHDDISMGSGEGVFGLNLIRNYNSGRRSQRGPFGNGWTHNYDTRGELSSDGFESFGEQQALNAIPTMIAVKIMEDVMTREQNQALLPGNRLIVGALINNWLMDQLVDNSVTVSHGGDSKKFVKIPGSNGPVFNPPLGENSTVTVDDTTDIVTFVDKNGNTSTFAKDGFITTQADPNGNTLSYTYAGVDDTRHLTKVTNNLGASLTFTYVLNRITEVTAGTNSVNYTYDNFGNLITYTDAVANKTTFKYDLNTPGILLQHFNANFPNTPYVTNVYDGRGKVAEQRDAFDNLYVYQFADGLWTLETNPEGNAHFLKFDERGNTLLDVDVEGHATQLQYDGLGRLTHTIRPEGSREVRTYDAKHNVLSVTEHPIPGTIDPETNVLALPLVQQWTYEPVFNKVATAIDPKGNVTTNEYDLKGNLTRIIQPPVAKPGFSGLVNPITTFTYNARGQVLTMTDPDGRKVTNTYATTKPDLLTTIGGPEGSFTYTYDAIGNRLTEYRPPAGATGTLTTWTYDAERRVTQQKVSGADGVIYRISKPNYDAENHVVSVGDARNVLANPLVWRVLSTDQYDAAGRLYKTTLLDGHVTTKEFDTLGRVRKESSSAGTSVEYTYDIASRLLTTTDKVTGALDPAVTVNRGTVLRETRTYFPHGQLKTLADANGNALNYAYDGFNRLQTVTYPNQTTESFIYDKNSNRRIVKKRDGRTIEQQYDALNRVTAKLPAGSPIISYGYDYGGNLLSAKSSAEATAYTFSYDPSGRKRSDQTPGIGGGDVLISYDEQGRRVVEDFDAIGETTYLHDPNGLKSVLHDFGFFRIDNDYDSFGRLSGIDQDGTIQENYLYNDLDLLTSKQNVLGIYPAHTRADFSYEYTKDHQRKSVTTNDNTYLPSGVIAASDTYLANSLNQYSHVSGHAFAYDLNGNLLSDGTWTYTYDVENRLLTATNGIVSASYTYDPLGRRRSKQVNGVVTLYRWLDDRIIAEYSGDGTFLRQYIYGTRQAPLAVRTGSIGSEVYQFLATDGLGSVIAVTNQEGVVTEKHAYTVYGMSASNTGVEFQFAGMQMDAETGLYYDSARFYSPKLGRFLQPDPIGTDGGINLYAYVGNDPVNYTDPTGHASEAINQTVTAAKNAAQLVKSAAGDFAVELRGGTLYPMAHDLKRMGNDLVNHPDRFLIGISGLAEALGCGGGCGAAGAAAAKGTAYVFNGVSKLARMVRPAKASGNVEKAFKAVNEFLGPKPEVRPGGGSDLILKNTNGTRQVRFDIKNSHGDAPHINVETWSPKAPGSARMIQDSNVHIYPTAPTGP
jgi:RHS repeat-associated protein